MSKLDELVDFKVGSPQFRIKEAVNGHTYLYYTIDNLRADLLGISENIDKEKAKQIATNDKVVTVENGDLIMSLVNPFCAIAGHEHSGFLLTQNFVKLKSKGLIDKKYLAYLLNEEERIYKQFLNEGSTLKSKITLKALYNIEIGNLPNLQRQQIIGDIYFKQKHLTQLRNKENKLKELYVIESIKRVG